jgi:hypothetical protein
MCMFTKHSKKMNVGLYYLLLGRMFIHPST